MMWYTAGRNIITHVCCSVCSSMFGHLLNSLPPDELRWPLATLRRAERQTYSNFLSPVCCGEVGTLSRFPTMHTEPKNGWHTQTYRVCCILSHLNVMKLYLWRFSWRFALPNEHSDNPLAVYRYIRNALFFVVLNQGHGAFKAKNKKVSMPYRLAYEHPLGKYYLFHTQILFCWRTNLWTVNGKTKSQKTHSPGSNGSWPNIGPKSVLSSRRWANVEPTSFALWERYDNIKNGMMNMLLLGFALTLKNTSNWPFTNID